MRYQSLLLLIILVRFCSGCSHPKMDDIAKPPNNDTIPANNINVILIVGDDVGYEIPTCDGGESYSTPHIDSMAQSGMRFTQCYAAPLCSPSRTMLLTGKYNFRNYYSWGILNKDQLTIGNLLKNSGYKTYYAGKWQLDGGDASIKKFGFNDYIVWLPFEIDTESNAGSRYKSPVLYANGNFIPSGVLKDKYAEDVYTDSIKSFIVKNAQKQFFVYYSMGLTHHPFCPTPGDKDYAGWNAQNVSHSDVKYFPEMVNYMDKKIGELIDFLKQNKLEKNTAIVFVGDNGSPIDVKSRFEGITITGEKKSTTTYGTHVPLIIYWPGKILPNSINNNLVCFPDFLPTLAALTHTSVPDAFKPFDGISFYNQLFGDNTGARNSVFCQFLYDTIHNEKPARWVQDTRYKLYDTIKNNYHLYGFYDMQNDIEEVNPLPDSLLSPEQQTIKQSFRQMLDSLK